MAGRARVRHGAPSLGALLALLLAGAALAAPPHVGERGAAAYQAYRLAPAHKAYAIAPGGAWAWVDAQPSAAQAQSRALERCSETTAQRCVPYAVDERVVFDADRWPTLWGPYATAAEARRRSAGTAPGMRFPDLRFRSAAGAPHRLADSHGAVRLIHFWGSWCPPCLRELPHLQRFSAALRAQAGDDFRLIMLPVRESFAQARQWLERNGLAELLLHDAATDAAGQWRFHTADGRSIADRELAQVFPTSYVLDRHGVVVFRHIGPIADWPEYAPFFRHLIAATAPQCGR